MNSEASSSESPPAAAMAGTTLQAVLQSSDGAMDSIAVPVPLPDVILRVHAETATELQFRRARTADSVLRYMEQETGSERTTATGAPSSTPPRRCARCHRVSAIYYIPKLPQQEPVTRETPAYCAECYGAAAG